MCEKGLPYFIHSSDAWFWYPDQQEIKATPFSYQYWQLLYRYITYSLTLERKHLTI